MNKYKEALQKIVNQPKEVVENGYYGNFEDIIHIAQQALSTEQSDPSEKLKVTGETSDGYHTFNELYEFRKVYNATLFNEWAAQGKYRVHKSMKHHDGELCFGGGWFIVVAVLPSGQISNHYEMSDWGLFDVPSFDKAQYEFDGHTSHDVIIRLQSLSPKKGKEESANYVARVCEKHVWGLVETTATGQEPKTNIQCLYCGASKENGFKHTEPNQTEAEKEVKVYEINFDGHVLTKIRVSDNEIIIEGAINGYGNKVEPTIQELPLYENSGENLGVASLARKQVIGEIEEFVKKESISATDEGGVFYENVVDSDYLLKHLKTLKK